MAQVIPIRDLKNTSEISNLCKNSGEPIIITKNGYGDMVIMDIDLYNRTMAKLSIHSALKQAEDELSNGAKPVEGTDFLQQIRKKYEKL